MQKNATSYRCVHVPCSPRGDQDLFRSGGPRARRYRVAGGRARDGRERDRRAIYTIELLCARAASPRRSSARARIAGEPLEKRRKSGEWRALQRPQRSRRRRCCGGGSHLRSSASAPRQRSLLGRTSRQLQQATATVRAGCSTTWGPRVPRAERSAMVSACPSATLSSQVVGCGLRTTNRCT